MTRTTRISIITCRVISSPYSKLGPLLLLCPLHSIWDTWWSSTQISLLLWLIGQFTVPPRQSWATNLGISRKSPDCSGSQSQLSIKEASKTPLSRWTPSSLVQKTWVCLSGDTLETDGLSHTLTLSNVLTTLSHIQESKLTNPLRIWSWPA
jgi:hypothetical protein